MYADMKPLIDAKATPVESTPAPDAEAERFVLIEWKLTTEAGKIPRLVGVGVPAEGEEENDRRTQGSPVRGTGPAPSPTRDYFTVVEAAARLGMSVAALKKRLARGARRDGRRIVCTIIGDTVAAVKLGTGPRATWRVHFKAEGER